MMHTTEVEEALMLKTMAEEVEVLIEKGINMLMMMKDIILQGVCVCVCTEGNMVFLIKKGCFLMFLNFNR